MLCRSNFKRRRCLLLEFLHEKSKANHDEEASSQDSEIRVRNQLTLSSDLLFKIFVLLPAESVFRLQFVCKMWFGLINSSVFIRCHSQQSEIVLIFRRFVRLESRGQVLPPGSEDKPRAYFHLLDLDINGGNNFIESSVVELEFIRASYNGLILATCRNSKSLILMNPVTRKHIGLPLDDHFYDDSYGIAFCNRTYKVVRLFRHGRGSIGCMIFHVCTRKWTRIEGPPPDSLIDIGKYSVSVGGSLNWIPLRRGCDYFVSLNVHNENFISKKLPVSSSSNDRLLDIGGNLGFVTYAHIDHVLQVWSLITDGVSGEKWIKKCSISDHFAFSPRAICFSKDGEGVVFEKKNELYDHNFETGETKLIRSRFADEVRIGRIHGKYIPHRNTLASWDEVPN